MLTTPNLRHHQICVRKLSVVFLHPCNEVLEFFNLPGLHDDVVRSTMRVLPRLRVKSRWWWLSYLEMGSMFDAFAYVTTLQNRRVVTYACA